jgi:hypothetical protein
MTHEQLNVALEWAAGGMMAAALLALLARFGAKMIVLLGLLGGLITFLLTLYAVTQ